MAEDTYKSGYSNGRRDEAIERIEKHMELSEQWQRDHADIHRDMAKDMGKMMATVERICNGRNGNGNGKMRFYHQEWFRLTSGIIKMAVIFAAIIWILVSGGQPLPASP